MVDEFLNGETLSPRLDPFCGLRLNLAIRVGRYFSVKSRPCFLWQLASDFPIGNDALVNLFLGSLVLFRVAGFAQHLREFFCRPCRPCCWRVCADTPA